MIAIEPLRIELKNFTCYGHEVFDFTPVTMAALCGPNGSGKSSLIDAMLWALFGQTPRTNAKQLDNIVRQGTDLAEVVFDFRLDERLYRVRRVRDAKRGRSSLELFAVHDGNLEPMNGANATETQGLIEKLLRMDYRTFVATSVIVQGKSDLLTSDMTDAERKDVLARILGLDQWEEAHEQVKKRIQEVRLELAETEARIKPLQDQIEAAAQVDQEIAAEEKALEEMSLILEGLRQVQKDRERIEALRHELAHIESIIADAQRHIEEFNEVIAKQEEIRQAYIRYQQLNEELKKLAEEEQLWAMWSSELAKANEMSARHEAYVAGELKRLNTELDLARSQARLIQEVPCTGTEFSARCQLLENARRAVARQVELEKRIEELQGTENPHLARIENIKRQMEELAYDPARRRALEQERASLEPLASLKTVLDNALSSQPVYLQRLNEYTAKQVKAMVELNKLTTNLKDEGHYGMTIEQAEWWVNRHRENLASLRLKKQLAEEAQGKLGELVVRKEELAKRLEVLTVLERACNKNTGVPTLIIESAVPQIEVFANDLLGRLTHGRFQVRLETQVQTKSGTIQEALRIMVLDQGSERPYETYSGGEKFLIDLSIRIALSRFLAHRAGASVNLLVIDEGIASMDVSRRHLIIEAINALKDEFRKVIVISHLPELEDAFPQRIEAVPGDNGTRLRLVA